jgi:hypothetical protein
MRETTTETQANKTDAGNGSYGICRVINASRSPSPDPKRSPPKENRTPTTMKQASITVAVAAFLGSITALAADLSPLESADSFKAARKQWQIEDSKRQAAAKTRDDSIAALRSDLSAPWTSLVVACRYQCSCTGTSFNGFKLVREKDAFSVAPWRESKPWRGKETESVGDTHPLPKLAVEQLLSETVLYFLAAILSVDPLEKVGRAPEDKAKHAEWLKEYLAAGGYPMASDHFSIEIRVSTPGGLKKHSDMFADHVPADFFRWIAAFGEVKNDP